VPIAVFALAGQAQDAPVSACSTSCLGGRVSNTSDPCADDSMAFSAGLYFRGANQTMLLGVVVVCL
jgi:hypothetical protein